MDIHQEVARLVDEMDEVDGSDFSDIEKCVHLGQLLKALLGVCDHLLRHETITDEERAAGRETWLMVAAAARALLGEDLT